MDFEMLKQVGVNVESAMERFMGNNALYAKMLKKILYEPAFGELVHAVSACDRQAALAASHTMQGGEVPKPLSSLPWVSVHFF